MIFLFIGLPLSNATCVLSPDEVKLVSVHTSVSVGVAAVTLIIMRSFNPEKVNNSEIMIVFNINRLITQKNA